MAKERIAKALAAPDESDSRDWIKDVNEHAGNAESLKLKVVNEKRPDVLSFRYAVSAHIQTGAGVKACAQALLMWPVMRAMAVRCGREKMLRFAAVAADNTK
jgi:hypothetical protein